MYTDGPGRVGGPLPVSRLTTIGTSTADAARRPARPWATAETGTRSASATNDPSAVSPTSLPTASPANRTPAPAGADTSRAPMAGAIPRPPAPPMYGDQLWPATAAAPAAAAAPGWLRPARAGPTAPLASSRSPTAISGPLPATSYNPLPETVPLPIARRSTPASSLAPMLEKGMAPAPKPTATAAAARSPLTRAPGSCSQTGSLRPRGQL